MYQTVGEKTEWLFLFEASIYMKSVLLLMVSLHRLLCFCLHRPFCESATTSVCSEQEHSLS